MYDYRNVKVDVHSEPGSVEVRLGDTRSVRRALHSMFIDKVYKTTDPPSMIGNMTWITCFCMNKVYIDNCLFVLYKLYALLHWLLLTVYVAGPLPVLLRVVCLCV